MTKPWKPRKAGWAGQWGRQRWKTRKVRRARRGFGAGELRLAALGGVLLGLVYASIPTAKVAAPEIEGRAVDPWATSRLSRAILEEQESAPPPFFGEGGSGAVASAAEVRVIDGDTFHYRGEKIRIADIDTPEVKGRCSYETKLAARATARMDELLGQGPFELQRIGRDEDRYGRKLRIVTRGGRSLGDQLVAEGLARTWTGRREPWCSKG